MNQDNLDDLTIICPTYNRPYILERSLKSYADNDFFCKIIIADSSESEAQKLVLEVLERYKSLLNLEYFHMPPPTDFGLKLYKASDRVSSEYCVIVPDDDLIIKSGLLASMKLLGKDPSVSAAYGNRLSIACISKPNDNLNWVKSFLYYYETIDQAEALNRMRRLPVPSFWNFPYAVCRSDELKISLHIIRDKKWTQFTEFFFYTAILSHGKLIKIDCLYALCSVDSNYYAYRDKDSFINYWGKLGSIMAQISQEFWSEHILTLSQRVAKISIDDKSKEDEVSAKIRNIYFSINNKYLEHNGLSQHLFDDNQFIAKKINLIRLRLSSIFWTFSLKDRSGGSKKSVRMFKGSLIEVLRGRFLKLLFLNFSWSRFKSLLVSISRAGSLDYEIQSLLNKKSKFHNDFIQVFDVWKKNPCPKKYEPNSKKS